MRAAGALPVYRAQDGDDTRSNDTTFEAVYEALRTGGLICIFPEGKSHDEPALQQLKTGAARMALRAEHSTAGGPGVRIVPVGLLYRAKRRFRSPVATWVGDPLEVRDLTELYRRDERRAVRLLTERIAEGLRAVTVTLDRWDDLPLLELAERSMAPDERLRVERLQALADGLRAVRARDPDRAEALTLRVAAFHERLERLGLHVEDLTRSYHTGRVVSYVLRNGTRLILGLPLAVVGALVWVLPYRLVPWATQLIGPSRAGYATAQIAVGAVVFLLWALVLAVLALMQVGWWAGFATLLVSPLLGLLALAFFDWRREVFEDAAVFLRVAGRRPLRERLLQEKEAIAAEIAEVRKTL